MNFRSMTKEQAEKLEQDSLFIHSDIKKQVASKDLVDCARRVVKEFENGYEIPLGALILQMANILERDHS